MKRVHLTHILALALCSAFSTPLPAEDAARPILSLDGTWEFRMDPKDEGVAGKWFDAGVAYQDKIQVPGNWQAQGFGEPIHLVRHNYQGIAWYRRDFEVPEDWAGKRAWLRFQSVCNNGEAFLNGHKLGLIESFVSPYEFDVTDLVRPGAGNIVTVRVDSGSTDAIARNNQFGAGAMGDPNSANGYVGMIQFLAKWGGIIGKVELQARPDPGLEELVIRPDITNKKANVGFAIRRNETAEAWSGRALVEIAPADGKMPSSSAVVPVSLGAGAAESGPLTVEVAIPDMRLWSPEDPFLYHVHVTLEKDGQAVDRLSDRTGMREFAVGGGNGAFILNDRPYFLRGIGYDSLEPITGTPMPDKNIYVERMRHLKDLGFNCVRMLAHTPIREFFDAADEVGILIQTDGELFLGGWSRIDEKTADLLARQVPRLIREHRNHPSWYAFSCMNEGGFLDAEDAAAKSRYIESAYKSFREMDPTRYFMASDGTNLGPSLWPKDIISSWTDFPKADAPTAPVAPAQVFQGELDGFAYFRRALPDAEMATLAAAAPGSPAETVDSLKPDGHWHGAAIAQGADLADKASSLLAKDSAPFSAGIWLKPAAFAAGDFGTPFSLGAAEPGRSLLVSLDGDGGKGHILIGRFLKNILTSQTALSLNEWNHVGLSYDGEKLRLFINGKLDGEIAEKLAIAPKDLKIGSQINIPVYSAEDYRSRPHVWHEFNQSYVGPLPDLDVEKKLIGAVITQEANLMVRHRARVDSFGLLGRYPSLRQTSFKSHYDYVKQAFESARQMPNLDGYHWWVISDIPAGFESDVTACGVLDIIYQPEKFAHPESFLPFNSASVLLIDADVDQRVLAADERKEISVSVSHYEADPVSDGRLSWQLTHDGKPLRQGEISGIAAPIGQITKIGSIELEPLQVDSAKQLVLETKLQSKAGTQSNSWKFWVFPAQKRDFAGDGIVNLTGVSQLDERYSTAGNNELSQAKLVLADKMTPDLLDFIVKGGGAILLEMDENLSARSRQQMMRLPQLTLARNASRILNESLGLPFWPRWIRCNGNFVEDHPALRDFPHEDFPDYQMARMFGDSVHAVDFSNPDSIARRKMRPLVWGLNVDDALKPVPNFPSPQEFFYGGMITEGRLGEGKVIICSLWALDGIKRGYPEAGYLLDCLVDYALKKPADSQLPPLTAEEARNLFKMQ